MSLSLQGERGPGDGSQGCSLMDGLQVVGGAWSRPFAIWTVGLHAVAADPALQSYSEDRLTLSWQRGGGETGFGVP